MNTPTNSEALPPTTCSVPWPIEDEYDYYENETSHLKTLVDACDLEWKGWPSIAKKLNATHGNNRTPSECRRQYEKISQQKQP